MDESTRIWGRSQGRRVGCILSIGTGKPQLREVGKRGHELIVSLRDIVTDVDKAAEEFSREIEDMEEDVKPAYFRFNVEQGLEEVGLEEWEHFERLVTATNTYLGTHRKDIRACANALLQSICM
jgi:hypothetical protein